jgi:hypothetical protein
MARSSFESLESRRLLAAVLSPVGAQPTGPLTGKIVYTVGGHGFTDNGSGVWSTQRGETNNMVEDLGNVDQMSFYADYAFRSGATVVPLRPVGHQVNEVILDNSAATFSGAWSDGASTPYFSTSAGSGVKYRSGTSSTTETAVATYTPEIPESGFYPVYTWALSGSNRATDQLYRVNHSGGSTEVRVDHTRIGKGWVYLGTYYFRAGTGGSVEVSNKSAVAGKAVIADAIRFGNGMGDVVRNGRTSGLPRESESTLYWIEAMAGWLSPGVRESSSNWRSSSVDDTANVSAPLRYATYMNSAPYGQSVYLSFHSNAGGGRGAVGLFNNEALFPGTATPNQQAWASYVGLEVTNDFVALGSPPLEYTFQPRSNPVYARSDYAFGEIRGDVNNDEFDATILEVAFHDEAQDSALLRDPFFRGRVALSSVEGTIKYFNQFGGAAMALPPLAPNNLRTSVDRDGNVTLRWDAPAASSLFGAAPTGYRVYASRDGYGFDGGATTNAATRTLVIPKSQVGTGTIYLKVASTNAGGESEASGVVAVRIGDARFGRVLIVNGFDRLRRQQNPIDSVALSGMNDLGPQASLLTIERVRPRESNSFDYAVQHAQAIANHPSNLGVDTVDNEAIINGNVNLSLYRAVIWIAGEESTQDRTFNTQEQNAVAAYVNGGGKFMVSGSEIGWDLVASGNGASFFANTLHAGYVSDDAGTYNVVGAAGSIFAGVTLNFDSGPQSYDAEFPDRLSAPAGSTSLLSYSGGLGGSAAIAWSGANGAKTLIFGFPFETIASGGARASLMRKALDHFGFMSLAPRNEKLGETPIFTMTVLATAKTRGDTLRKSVATDVLA